MKAKENRTPGCRSPHNRHRGSLAVTIALLLCCGLSARPAFAYLPDINPSTGALVVWPNNTTTYQVSTDIAGTQFTADDQSRLPSIMQQAFAAWTAAPNTSLSVSRSAGSANVVCFNCQDEAFSNAVGSGAETLAITYVRSQTSGQGTVLTQATMHFNPAVKFITTSTPGSPVAGSFTANLLTVAMHEAGHFFGLDHSAVLRAAMYPYSAPLLTTLSYDDVAGISLLYPKASADYATGSISGTIRFAESGAGVYGAHVYADSLSAATAAGGSIRKSPIGILTRQDGTYTITGLPADNYRVVAEPLDGPVQDGDIRWFDVNSQEQRVRSVDSTFNTRWH